MTDQYLNAGCGSVQPSGWVNVDRQDFGQPHAADFALGTEWGDGTFKGIVCNHSIQESTYDETPKALRELRRILAADGLIRILVPDVTAAVSAYQNGDIGWFPVNDNEPTLDDKFCVYLNWFGTARSLYTNERLIDVLERAGYTHITPRQLGESEDPKLASLDDRGPEHPLIYEARPV